MKAIRLQTEYLTEPLGLGNPRPSFYRNCESGVMQTAFQVICKRIQVQTYDVTALRYAETSYRSPYGEVFSRWERSDKGVSVTVTVPTNCTAEIRLPKGRTEKVTAGRYTYEA